MASITMRIEEEEKNAIREIAKVQDLSMSQAIRRAIREYIEKYSQSK